MGQQGLDRLDGCRGVMGFYCKEDSRDLGVDVTGVYSVGVHRELVDGPNDCEARFADHLGMLFVGVDE